MNRKQRRAAAKQGFKVDQFRRLSERMVDAKPIAEFDPSHRALLARIRPLKVSDMAPGYAYEPDLILFEIELPAVPGQMGSIWQMPVWVPEQFREPSVENTRAVYAWVYSTDPEARTIIDDMCARARPWGESQAAFNGPREYLGRRWLPPINPTPPDASAPTSMAKN